MADPLGQAALDYHRYPTPGKIAVTPTKGMSNQRDLALAYSPGVAVPCLEIQKDPLRAYDYTAKGNLVAVVSNGTAVLGLGNIGAVAGKPVMEGKGCLFKKFAGIDVFDIELAENDPDALIETIARMEPTFGGINLEDIKAPECFYIEQKLRERMKIPVFHDDQHGTAIVVGAAVLNGLHLQGKALNEVKLVTSGAGAAALACLDLLVMLGIPVENIWVTDIEGVVYEGRTVLMDPIKARYAKKTEARKLAEIIEGADVFLGLSAGGVLKGEMVAKMAARPLILALAACGGQEEEPAPDQATLADVSVTGDFGTEPTVDFNAPIVFPQTSSEVLTEGPGKGPKIGPGSTVKLDYYGMVARDASVYTNTFEEGKPATFPIDDVIPGLLKGLRGSQAGDRVLIAVNSKDGYDPTGNGESIIEGDSLVFVVDVHEVENPPPPVPLTQGTFPQIDEDDQGNPTGFSGTKATDIPKLMTKVV